MKTYKTLKEEFVTSAKSSKHTLVDAIVLTPNKQKVVWQYVKCRDVVAIIAINKKHEMYCVRQWRPARNKLVWEIPAGGIERKNPTTKDILQNANRELQEEIGFKASKLEIIAKFTPGIHIFANYYIVLATDLVKSELPRDINEDIEVKLLPFNRAYDLLVNKELPSALTLIGMELLKERLKKNN